MSSKYETAVYTREQIENARTKGQLMGWIQGAASVGILMFLLQFLGWIPLLLIAAVVGFGGYKVITRK
ncbi:hypothetical protein HQ496_01475 [bacterium]|nr:hypothetical protein [bacterium]